MLRALGYQVYDSDREARLLMEADAGIRAAIAERIDAGCVASEAIDRRRLGSIVFADPAKLNILNSIVHSAVRHHLAAWVEARPGRRLFVETAILYQSGLDQMVEEVWEVTAPTEVRIERVMRRNGLPRPDVEARISAQQSYIPSRRHPLTHILINDNRTPLLPQLESLL